MNEINLKAIVDQATTMMVQVEQMRKVGKTTIAIDSSVLNDLAFHILALTEALGVAAKYRELAIEMSENPSSGFVAWADRVKALKFAAGGAEPATAQSTVDKP